LQPIEETVWISSALAFLLALGRPEHHFEAIMAAKSSEHPIHDWKVEKLFASNLLDCAVAHFIDFRLGDRLAAVIVAIVAIDLLSISGFRFFVWIVGVS
jgi:hypothetical protein